MTTLYLVRHAEAEGNIERKFQGHFDGKISENGEKQLKYLKNRFRKVKLNAIYTSPLSRAVATAEAVDYYAELPLVLDRSLLEICGGAFEGRKYAELPDLFPEEWEHWDKEPHKFHAPGGESMRQCYDRMCRVMNRILHSNMGHTVAVVSHGCALRNYLCHVTDTPFELLDTVPWGDNTCVSRIDFDSKFRPKIAYLNDISHLPEDLSTLAKQNWWRKDGSTEEPEMEEDQRLIHVDMGELYLQDDNVDITAGDLLTPGGAVPLSNVRLRVAEGTAYLHDDNIKLTSPPKEVEHTVVLTDDPEPLNLEMTDEEPLSREELGMEGAADDEDGFVEEDFQRVSVGNKEETS